jgi:hypothetical protein
LDVRAPSSQIVSSAADAGQLLGPCRRAGALRSRAPGEPKRLRGAPGVVLGPCGRGSQSFPVHRAPSRPGARAGSISPHRRGRIRNAGERGLPDPRPNTGSTRLQETLTESTQRRGAGGDVEKRPCPSRGGFRVSRVAGSWPVRSKSASGAHPAVNADSGQGSLEIELIVSPRETPGRRPSPRAVRLQGARNGGSRFATYPTDIAKGSHEQPLDDLYCIQHSFERLYAANRATKALDDDLLENLAWEIRRCSGSRAQLLGAYVYGCRRVAPAQPR